MTKTRLSKLKQDIEVLVQKAVQQGYYLTDVLGAFLRPEMGACCLIGAITPKNSRDPRLAAAEMLGVGFATILDIESGFEYNWNEDEDTDLHALGKYFRDTYT